MTVEELRYSIIGSLALLEFLKAARGERPHASIAELRKSVEPEVVAFEALIRAEGALEENAKWEQWTGQSRHPHPMCKCSIPDLKEVDNDH